MVTIRLQTQIKTYGKLIFFAFGVHLDSKMAPRWPQDGPRWPQDGPKMAQDGLKMAQDGPRWPQEAPKCFQDGFKNH
jgi:hypothetical protein